MERSTMSNAAYNRIIFRISLLSTLLLVSSGLDYRDLKKLGVTCPERDSCVGYTRDISFADRNCECDPACESYGDCCIDAYRRRTSSKMVPTKDVVCLNYGEGNHTGVYAVASCSSEWDGSEQVRQKCEGPPDFSDLVSASPVTSTALSQTFKNIFCAKCNYVHDDFLEMFDARLSCEGLDDIPQEQIMDDLFYDQQRSSWGVKSSNAEGNPTFVECDIIFDIPIYLQSRVRFCRANVISTCARDWTRFSVRAKCEQYTAVVHDGTRAYRNPHCAICNHRSVEDITCKTSPVGRRRPMNFGLLVDTVITRKDGDKVGTSLAPKTLGQQCPEGHLYDPFFMRCRKLVCALPGYKVMNGKCVPGDS